MSFNVALITLNASWYAPPGANLADVAQLHQWIDSMSFTGLLMVLTAHVGHAAFVSWVAARLSASRPRLMALLVGFVTVTGSVQMLTTYTSPSWMVVEVPLALGLAWWAGRVDAKRRIALPR